MQPLKPNLDIVDFQISDDGEIDDEKLDPAIIDMICDEFCDDNI